MKALAAFVGAVVTFAAFAPSALGGLTDAAPTDAAAPVTNATAPTTTAGAPVLQTANTTAAPLTTAAAPVVQAATTTAAPVVAPVATAVAPVVQTVANTTATAVSAAAPVTKRVTPIAATADRPTPTARQRDEITTVQSPVQSPAATAASGSTEARISVSVAPTAGQDSTKIVPPVTRRGSQPTGTVLPASTPDALIAPSPSTTDTHGAREPRAQAPDSPLPGLPLRDTIPGLAGTLSAAGSSGSVVFIAALLTLFMIAIPSVGRWLRPVLDVARPSGFVSPIEVPG
jgi:hypothetical protein